LTGESFAIICLNIPILRKPKMKTEFNETNAAPPDFTGIDSTLLKSVIADLRQDPEIKTDDDAYAWLRRYVAIVKENGHPNATLAGAIEYLASERAIAEAKMREATDDQAFVDNLFSSEPTASK
jgi:hypothetical protein